MVRFLVNTMRLGHKLVSQIVVVISLSRFFRSVVDWQEQTEPGLKLSNPIFA
jgi:hypothetical protein